MGSLSHAKLNKKIIVKIEKEEKKNLVSDGGCVCQERLEFSKNLILPPSDYPSLYIYKAARFVGYLIDLEIRDHLSSSGTIPSLPSYSFHLNLTDQLVVQSGL